MDSPFECKVCPNQWASTASRQGEANNRSRFKLKKVKVVLRDIHEPRSSLPKEHLQGLCESCRPRRAGYPSVAEHGGRFKRGCKKKNCEELLNSWKAPTRRHTLPRRLHDFVVDNTVLHLIEFSSWYNRGQIARRYDPVEHLLAEQRGVTSWSRRPGIGKMKSKRTDTREHELNKLKKERNWKRYQSSSCFVSKAWKPKPQCPDKTKIVRPEVTHRGRPKTCNNAHKIRSSSSSSLAEPRHQSIQQNCKHKKYKDSPQTMLSASSRVAKGKPRGRDKECKDDPGRPKKCKVTLQTMPAIILKVAKNKPRGTVNKCKNKPQTKSSSASSSALPVPKHQGRPKKCMKAPENTRPCVKFTCIVAPKHQGPPKKCKKASEIVPSSVTTVVAPKDRGRPKKCRKASKIVPSSVTTVVAPKDRDRPKKCKKASEIVPSSVTTVVAPKDRGRPKKCKKPSKIVPSSVTTVVAPKDRGRPKKRKKAFEIVPSSVTTVVAPKDKGRPKKCKKPSKIVPSSVTSVVAPKDRGRPKKRKKASEIVPSSVTTLVVPKNSGRPKKRKKAFEIVPSVTTLIAPKNRGRPKKRKNASEIVSSLTTLEAPKNLGRPKKDKTPKTKSTSLPCSRACKHPNRPKKLCEDTLKFASEVAVDCKQVSAPARIRKRKDLLKTKKKATGKCHQNKEEDPLKIVQDTLQTTATETECLPEQLILEKLASTVNCLVEPRKSKDLADPCSQSQKTTRQAPRVREKRLSAVDANGSSRPKKRKCGILTSNQDGQNTLEDKQACTQRLPPSINPDFSIDDSDAGMNIEEYLVQLGTYLERKDQCESTTVGVANEFEKGLFDENDNLVSDSEIPQKRNAGVVQSHGGVIDVGTKDRMGINPEKDLHDVNNNLISNVEILKGNDTERRQSDSGISDVSYDLVTASQSKRIRRLKKRREQPSSDCLNLRRSERLRVKEDYRRCNAVWTNEGNQSRVGRSSRGNLLGRGSRYPHESLKTSLDDDLLQEFVAMCPLDGDLPFSDEDCRSLLVESPTFSGIGWPTSCFIRPDDQGLGSQAVDETISICPRNPPKVRRNLQKFLLDKYSIHLLASRPIQSPPRHGQELDQNTAQECDGVSPGALQISPGFGPLTDIQVTMLKQLGLDGTQEEPAGDLMEDVSRSERAPLVGSHLTVQSRQVSDFSNQDLSERSLQNMEEQIKDQSVGGACETLKLRTQKGPMVVIPGLYSQMATIAAVEVWLPSCVVVSSADNVFFKPLGEWSVADKAWHIPNLLWRNSVDNGWHLSEIQGVVAGTCFVPEEAWLASKGARDKTCNRVYDIRPMSKGPGAPPGPRVPVTVCHSSRNVNPLKPERRKPKKWQCVPIPGVPPPFDMQSCLQPRMHPTNPYPLNLPMPIRFSSTPDMVHNNDVGHSRPELLIPAFDHQQQPRLLETAAAAQNVVQPPGSFVENPGSLTHPVTSGHLIGLDGYLAMTHDHSYCISSNAMAEERTSLVTEQIGDAHSCDVISNDCRNNQQGTLSASHTRDRVEQKKEQPSDMTLDINNNDNSNTGVSQSDQSPVMITDINNNNIISGAANNVKTNEPGLSEVTENIHKVPSSVQEAVDQIHACKEVTDLGQLLLEWCKSNLSFRRHNQILLEIADRLKRGSSNQSSQNFCVFAASFHAVSQKDDYIPDYEDKCVLVQLGLSAVSKCLDKDQQDPAQNQVQSQPLQIQLPQAQCKLMQVQDLPVPAQVQSQQGPSHTTQLQDQQRLVQAQQVQNQAMQVQQQPVQDPLMQVQPSHLPGPIQNQAVQVQTQPREDAYCILQMLLHLKLPLTEVLASLSLRPFHDPSQEFPEVEDSSGVRDVLGVLIDFDPAIAFNVIQGLGWGHTVLELSHEKEGFGQQLVALAEALLDCKKFWQCRMLLGHLNAYEFCRQPCRHLYSSLLGKLLDTQPDHEPAMMVFEDMMESYLIVPAPILSKLLMQMWKRTDDEGMEDALCVFHYGLGLGIYPMYRKVKDGVWEAMVYIGATDAEVFFSLKTLLEEVHHQQDGPLEGGSSGISVAEHCVQDVDSMLPGKKSLRFAGSGRCGAKRQTVRGGGLWAFKKKGRRMALTGQDVQIGKQPPKKTSEAKTRTRVSIRLVEPQQGHQGNLPIPDDMIYNYGFSRMLSLKHTIQDVLKNYFHPLAITPTADGWKSHQKKVSHTLAINEDALQSWLIAQGERETNYLMID